MVCADEREGKMDRLAAEAAAIFDVQVEKGLTLLTIRHYTAEVLDAMTAGKVVVLRQQSKETVQVLMR
jgi:aspartate kinase